MNERLKSYDNERTPLPKRLEYGAVPLDALRVNYPGTNLLYRDESYRHITEQLNNAVRLAEKNKWAENSKDSQSLKSILDISLYSSHNDRMMRNPQLYHLKDIKNDDLVDLAMAGLATPTQLLDLLERYPALGSIELAKLSHPLDFAATAIKNNDDAISMDEDISSILERKLTEEKIDLPADPSKYKLKTHGMNHPLKFPALTMLRKTPVADIFSEGGVIRITMRESFLVRGDEHADYNGQGSYFSRRVRVPSAKNETIIAEAIEAKLTHVESLNDKSFTNYWLQPIATSCYAKFIQKA